MRFTKCHGAGNDFVVIDARTIKLPWDSTARQICDRHYGVGSDGIILVTSGQGSNLGMRMFNPDGSEAEACGNGLRCFTKYVVDHGLVTGNRFLVDTLGGTREVKAYAGADGTVDEVEAGMGCPSFEAHQIPVLLSGQATPMLSMELRVLDVTIPVSLVSMGNPHAVTFVTDDVAAYPLERVGPAVEHHRLFPSRVNFEVAQVVTREEVKARVWERGAAETLACGSGACAIAVTGQLLGYVGSSVRVHLPGGKLTTTWRGQGTEVRLRGPVTQVFVGDWPD